MKTGLSRYYDKEDYVFIFNPTQKDFYVKEGLSIVDSGVNEKTHKIFWVFDKKESNPIYTKWLYKCDENRLSKN